MSTQEQYIQTMILGIRGQLNQIERVLRVRPVGGKPSMELIIWGTAKYFGVTPDELVGKSQQPHLVEPRHVAMYLCRELTKASHPVIGRAFNRHHTSVMMALRRIDSRGASSIIADVRKEIMGAE